MATIRFPRIAFSAVLLVACASPADPARVDTPTTGQASEGLITDITEIGGIQPIGRPELATNTVATRCLANDMARTTYGTSQGIKSSVASCFPYRCDATAGTCATSCLGTETLGTCAEGAICQNGRCVAQRFICAAHSLLQSTVRDADGYFMVESCGRYACNEFKQACRTSCRSGTDCAWGYDCTSHGTCVMPAEWRAGDYFQWD